MSDLLAATGWIGEHAMRMSAGCVQIGGGFAHVADTKKLPPPGHPEWGQQLPNRVQVLVASMICCAVRNDLRWMRAADLHVMDGLEWPTACATRRGRRSDSTRCR